MQPRPEPLGGVLTVLGGGGVVGDAVRAVLGAQGFLFRGLLRGTVSVRVLSYPVARGRAPPSSRPILPGLSCGIPVPGGFWGEGGAWLPDGQGVTETRVEAQEGRAAGEVAQGADKPL